MDKNSPTTTNRPGSSINTFRHEQWLVAQALIHEGDSAHLLRTRCLERDFTDPFLRQCFQAVSSHPDTKPLTACYHHVEGENVAYQLSKLITDCSVYTQPRFGHWHLSVLLGERRQRLALEASDDLGETAIARGDVLGCAERHLERMRYLAVSDTDSPLLSEYLPDHLSELTKQERLAGGIGLELIDRHTGGLRAGNLVTIGARPGIGKTALALTAVRHNCNRDRSVLFISLEMARGELINRLLASESGVPLSDLTNHTLSSEQRQKLVEVHSRMDDWKFAFNCDVSTVSDIYTVCQTHRQAHGLDMLVVDYLGLLRHPNSKASRYEQVSDNCRSLKQLAMQLKIPVIMLCQLNRDQKNPVPTLHNLRDSGQIEQDSDLVFLMYKSKETKTRMIELQKFRNGPAGVSFEYTFDGELQRFEMPNRVAEFDDFNADKF